ncbi:MAG TPA: glycoside hydrolase family 16 protein [Polyangiaceae bacterium]|nr:glycoside hydrolase family 16 protein [Polyangiaceae bacterium]
MNGGHAPSAGSSGAQVASGGTTTGGAATGGTTTGGTTTGGAATGGAGSAGGETPAKGGAPASGGIPSGGANPSGGSQANSGGAATSGGATSAGTGSSGSPATSTGGSTTSGGAVSSGGTSSGGATGGAGVAGQGGLAQGGTAGSGPFVLSWEDDFSTLNPSLWQEQNFSYEGNEATFNPGNATAQNGIVTMALTRAPSGASKPYLGVELRSTKTLTYGKISARMRFAKGSGVVSGLVLFYTPFPNCDWNEIDIEHLGKASTSSQLNAMVYTGTVQSNCTSSVTPVQDPLVSQLGFDAESDFHLYDIEWTPAGVNYFADGMLLRTWRQNIALLRRPMNILLTVWASSAASWAGSLDANSAPSSAQIDWIKVYDWRG